MAVLSDDEIVARFKRGDISRNALARLAACSRSKVDRVLAVAGYDLVPGHLDAERVAVLIAHYIDGASLADTAHTAGLATNTTALILMRAKVLRRPGRRPGGRFYPDVDVLGLYRIGGVQAIADKAQVSITTAYRLLRDAKAKAVPTIWAATAPCSLHAEDGCLDCEAQTALATWQATQ